MQNCCDNVTPISKDTTAYTTDQLMSMFQNDQNDFQEVAQIFLTNELFLKKGKTDRSFATMFHYADDDKQHFSSEDWEKICTFFNETNPYSITRYQNSVIGFHYVNENRTGNNAFYYFAGDKTDVIYHGGKYDNFTEIAPNWYIGEENED